MNIELYKEELSTKCTGCGMCSNICPKNAIKMSSNQEGFVYPDVDIIACVDCGLCANNCPQLNENKKNETIKYYAAIASEEVRSKGSSGGIFPALANQTIQNGGVVFGATFSEDCKNVVLKKAETSEELDGLFKSKYVQANPLSAYREVKDELFNGKKVLFSGCPCQVDGLKSFLGKEYDNLLTVDILCHGAPSPRAYKSFIEELSDGKSITSVDFRDKTYGWGTLIKVVFDDGEFKFHHWNGEYFKAFLSGLIVRESCYKCPYACKERVGDITLGDFWNIKEIDESLDDKNGTSIVCCNTEKGINAITDILDTLNRVELIDNDVAIKHQSRFNAAISRPLPRPDERKIFFKHLQMGDDFFKAYRYSQKSIMDFGILGWWIETPHSNYGSTLTDYALYKYLEDQGYSVGMISPPDFDRSHAGSFNKTNKYRMTAKYSAEDMKQNNKYFDGYIVASDVLWYFNAMIKTGYMFMLDFASDDKKKISYSTSFGNVRGFIPDEEMPKAKYLLKRFDSISTREFEGVDICNEKFDIDAQQVMDPVFLPEMFRWKQLADRASRRTEGKYVFAYYLDPNEKKISLLKEVADRKGLKVVSITDKQTNTEEKEKMLSDCGILRAATIDEFVWHLMNADCVLTDSFHGFCFSLIFNKPFFTFVNSVRGASRFETLSQIAGVEDRLIIDGDNSTEVDDIYNIDYTKINEYLNKKISYSKEWLEIALNTKKDISIDYETIADNKIYDLNSKIKALEDRLEQLEMNHR